MNSTFLLFYSPRPRGNWSSKLWELSVQLKIPEISVGTSIGTDHFGLIRPEYSGPALKVFHFDRSGYLGGSARNNPFHLSKLLSPVPLFWYPAYKNNNQKRGCLVRVCATGMYRFIGYT